jgi:hypothetical protein
MTARLAFVLVLCTTCACGKSGDKGKAQKEYLDQLRRELGNLMRAHMRFQKLRRRYQQIDLRRYEHAMPSSAELPAFMAHVQKRAADSGVIVKSWKRSAVVPRPGGVVQTPVVLEVTGGLGAITSFLAQLGPRRAHFAPRKAVRAERVSYERPIIVDALSMRPAGKAGGVRVFLRASVFHRDRNKARTPTPPKPLPRLPTVAFELRRKFGPADFAANDPFVREGLPAHEVPPPPSLRRAPCSGPPQSAPTAPALPDIQMPPPTSGDPPDPGDERIQELRRHIARLRAKLKDYPRLTQALATLEAHDQMIGAVEQAQVSFAWALYDLLAVTALGKPPTMTKDMTRRVQSDPNRHFASEWSSAHLRLDAVDIVCGKLQLRATGLTSADTLAFTKRLQASAYFRNVQLDSGDGLAGDRGYAIALHGEVVF